MVVLVASNINPKTARGVPQPRRPPLDPDTAWRREVTSRYMSSPSNLDFKIGNGGGADVSSSARSLSVSSFSLEASKVKKTPMVLRNKSSVSPIAMSMSRNKGGSGNVISGSSWCDGGLTKVKEVASDSESASSGSSSNGPSPRPRGIVVPARFCHQPRLIHSQSSPIPAHIHHTKRVNKSLATNNLSNRPSILSFPQLRLVYNRVTQWRFINARAESSLSSQKLNAQKSLYTAWVSTSKLRESVRAKRIELQLLRQNLKLTSILKGQMAYLEDWALIDHNYSTSLLGAMEALRASTLRLQWLMGQGQIFSRCRMQFLQLLM